MIFKYYSNIWEKIQMLLKYDKNNILYMKTDLRALMTVHCWIFRNVSGKYCRKNQKTSFMFNNFFSENRVACETMRKNIVQPKGSRLQYNMAHALCVLDEEGYRPSRNMQHCYSNAPYCYVLRKLSVLFMIFCEENSYIHSL